VLVKYESEIDPQTKVGIYIHISPTLVVLAQFTKNNCLLTTVVEFSA
jgi:hypothetical protein